MIPYNGACRTSQGDKMVVASATPEIDLTGQANAAQAI